ncbi:MAG: hypothetical protein HY939_07925 [Gammaproteobacteria bacterium]|nr:hypothetical protein [Gammaproteobacteria bacterium]
MFLRPSLRLSATPSFTTHRITTLQEEMGYTLPRLQATLASLPQGDPQRLKVEAGIMNAYLQLNYYDEAIEAGKKFEAESEQITRIDPVFVIRQRHMLATALREKQRFAEAEEIYMKGAPFLNRLNLDDATHRKVRMDFVKDLGIFYLYQKKYNQASQVFSVSVKFSEGQIGLEKVHLTLQNYLALSFGLTKNFDVALPQLESIRQQWLTQVSVGERETTLDYSLHLYHTAHVREKWAKQLFAENYSKNANEQIQLAIRDLRESIRIREKLIPTRTSHTYTNSRLADPLWLLGKLLISIKQTAEGKAYLRRATTCYMQMNTPSGEQKARRVHEKWLSLRPRRHSIFASPSPQVQHADATSPAAQTSTASNTARY